MLSTQSKRIEKPAKSTDEAIELALNELGVTKDMVEIEILDEGTKGLFGILGSKEARVAVTVKAGAKDVAEDFLNNLFFAMGMKVDLDITEDDDSLNINLIGDDMGIVIGKRGDTLDAIQYLTSLVANRIGGAYKKVSIDTENYRAKRQDALHALSARIADKVVKTGRRHTFEPMNPYERRIIHASLQDHELVHTYSIGEDPNRKVVVALKSDTRGKRL